MRVLVIDGALPDRAASAGERATFDLIDALTALGHEVSLTALGLNGDEPRREAALNAAGIEVLPGYGGGLDHLQQVIDAQRWQVAIVHRPGPALASSGLLMASGAAMVFWGHDIHTWRLRAQKEHASDVPAHQLRVTEFAERHSWSAYDVTAYPTSREARYVEEGRPGHAVAVPYYRLLADDLGAGPGPDRRAGCLMVGSWSHAPNADAVRFAAQEVLPLLDGTDATLTVVGRWPQEARLPGVRYTGRVSEERLRAMHDEHLCLLAPLRFGAGSRRKLVAAMGLGLPVVTTPEGLRGLLVRDAQPGDGPLVATEPHALAALVAGLRADPELWHASAHTARRAVTDVYAAPRFDEQVRYVIEMAMRSRSGR